MIAALVLSFAFFGIQTPCHAGILPDRGCTPGTVQTVSLDAVCTPGWATAHRHVTYVQRRRIFARYGIAWERHTLFELDHLIPLELGGSNRDSNLWPERYPYAYRKDRVEDRLHREVCAGRLVLRLAQLRISHNWRTA